jgi:hypothetical protein
MGRFTTVHIVAAMACAALVVLVVAVAVRLNARQTNAMREFADLGDWQFHVEEAPVRKIIDPVLRELYGGSPFQVSDILQAADGHSTYFFRCSGRIRSPRREFRVCCMAEKPGANVPGIVWIAPQKPGTVGFVRDRLDPAVPGFQDRFLVASATPGAAQAVITPELQRTFLSGMAGLDGTVETWITGRWILMTTLSESPQDWNALVRATRSVQQALR